MIPWILVSIGVAAIVLAIIGILLYKKSGWKRKVDYRSYYNMGIIWLPLGIVFWLVLDNPIGIFFFIMGLSYLSIGLKNRDKWGKPQKILPKYQKTLMISVLIGVIILILGILIFELLLAS